MIIPELEQPWEQHTEQKPFRLGTVIAQDVDAKREDEEKVCRTADDSKCQRKSC
jgi:hypothetical protein